MASLDFSAALTAAGISESADRTAANTVFTTRGIRPQDIMAHTEKKTYCITGITPEEFLSKHGGPEFDFQSLMVNFKIICTDFGKILNSGEKSKAVEFCSKMIYEVGPMTRQVTKSGGDEVYKFMFIYGKNDMRVAFVCTFKSTDPKADYDANTKIILTVKQAMLLAIKVLEQLNEIGLQMEPSPICLLTPLAGAVFSKEDITKMAIKLSIPANVVLNMINASSQSGGHYMVTSDMACAAVCVIMSTKGLKDKDIKISIICKTLRQYASKQKDFKLGNFEVLSEFAHGGVPDGLELENLIATLDRIQEKALTVRKSREASEQTGTTTAVITPTTSPTPNA